MAALNSNLTINEAQQELQGMLHGQTLNSIQDIYGVFYRAGRRLLADIDPQETKCIENTQPIFSGVWDYPVPTDLKGDKIVDLRPQVNRNIWDVFVQRYGQEFDLKKDYSIAEFFTIRFNNGVKSMRVNAPFIPLNQLVNGCSNTLNWTYSSNISNVIQDTVNYADSLAGASIAFNVASGTNPQSAVLTNSLNSDTNLTGFVGQSSFFLWVFMPTGADFSTITLNIGSSASNYYQFTATQTQEGTAYQNGWNLIQFIWTPQTTQVGTPNSALLTYIQISLTYNGTAMNAVRICGLYCRVALVYDIEYYSRYIFADATTQAFKEIPSSINDYINLDTDSYNLYMWALACEAVQQQNSAASKEDLPYFENKYVEAREVYTKKYASESEKPQSQYYSVQNRRNTRYLGRYSAP
jgi:hypothetical protein